MRACHTGIPDIASSHNLRHPLTIYWDSSYLFYEIGRSSSFCFKVLFVCNNIPSYLFRFTKIATDSKKRPIFVAKAPVLVSPLSQT